jgi:GNAT superfamily N-acetyltransferase
MAIFFPVHLLEECSRFVAAEWNRDDLADFFIRQATNAYDNDGGCYGSLDLHGKVQAVGLITRSEINFAVWGISWLVVRSDVRRRGQGTDVVATMQEHAIRATLGAPGETFIIQLATQIPDFYARLGFTSLLRWSNNHSLMARVLPCASREA